LVIAFSDKLKDKPRKIEKILGRRMLIKGPVSLADWFVLKENDGIDARGNDAMNGSKPVPHASSIIPARAYALVAYIPSVSTCPEYKKA